ncbi:origin recognition complex subunit 2-domain-containing protein [Phyllosticta citribraziliensis]
MSEPRTSSSELDASALPRRADGLDHEDHENDELDPTPSQQETPTKRQNVSRNLANDLRRAQAKDTANGGAKEQETPRSQRRVAFDTPTKPHEDEEAPNATPTILKSADRSARRKSARRLLSRQLNDDQSDEDSDEEDELAREIYDEEEGEDEGEEEEDQVKIPEPSAVPDTPSKRGRGRPKGSKNKTRKNSPPPEGVPPHELYFYQNRPGGGKTSNNTLASHQVLNHDEYFAQMSKYEDPHQDDIEFLHELHGRSFDQWVYELENDFNICLYGYGSKRRLAMDFATHLYHYRMATAASSKNSPKIIIINGYNPTLTPKDILLTILSSLLPSSVKLPSTPPLLHSLLETTLATNPPSKPLTLIVNSIDSPSLRRPASQTLLTTLAANKHFHMLATADTPTFPLLWDLSARSQLRFLFHDSTTFASFAGVELDAVDTFADVLGRSSRRLAGRDGVGYVLRSLPENARGLFRILVAEQIAAAVEVEDDDVGLGSGGAFGALDDDDDPFNDAALAPDTPSKRGRGRKGAEKNAMDAVVPAVGVEYRVLYHKAVEEFVCSNEMGFRTLLKEFHDHQMIESRKDAGGTERLWVPFRREDLEALLEELVD